jgi:FkbM family methyltransferase
MKLVDRLAGAFPKLFASRGRAPHGFPNPDFDPLVHQQRVRKWQESNGEERFRGDYERLNAESIVLDLGGYHGAFSLFMNAKYGALCHVFEVIPEFCSSIEAARGDNPKIVVHPFGLAGSTRKEQLFLAGQGSSTFANRGSESRQITIQLVKASQWFDRELEGRSVDLMKINIEGGEYELLEHMIGEGLVRRLRNILVQFHEDVISGAVARMERIQSALSKTHRLTFQERFVWENWELLD